MTLLGGGLPWNACDCGFEMPGAERAADGEGKTCVLCGERYIVAVDPEGPRALLYAPEESAPAG